VKRVVFRKPEQPELGATIIMSGSQLLKDFSDRRVIKGFMCDF
jgi:hypothetical protein